MSDTLSLATRLRGLGDERLVTVIRERAVSAHGVNDFFDLAESLLDRASVQRAMVRLDRGTLRVLAAVAENGPSTAADVVSVLAAFGAQIDAAEVAASAEAAADLLLLETESGRYAAYDAVREQLRSWPGFGLPGLAELAGEPSPAALEPVPDSDLRFIDRLAAERAFAAITAITELISELERQPARELAKGGIALPDSKRLAAAMNVELGQVPEYLAVAASSALVAQQAAAWLPTEFGGSWVVLSSAEKWGALAAAWHSRLPADIRSLLAERSHATWGHGLRAYLDWLFPGGGEWMEERITTRTAEAELLGLSANQAPSTPGSLLLAEGPDAAQSAMAELLPAEVAKVYLQHDLSVVAPGPLTPAVDARLRSMADVENRALASSYRVSTASVNRAMAAGESRQSLLEFLGEISLSGIPQPLEYLIDEASTRYGLVRAGAADDGGSYLRSSDDALLGTILVDHSLSPLGLHRIGDGRLASRFPLDVVFWAVSDARYPVAAELPSGDILSLSRQRAPRPVAAVGSDATAELVARLRADAAPAESPGDDDQAWLRRQLDVAIRGRSALTVSVEMPSGVVVDYQLEPTAIAGGRLRARDRKSAIERTLPLSRITAVGPAL